MKTKVCGLKYLDNIRQVAQLPIDYMGFIFYKKSPRYIGDALNFDTAREIPRTIKKTGVFVNESSYSIFEKTGHYNLDAVQLHGHEPPELCADLKPYVTVIKSFSISHDFDFKSIEPYLDHIHYCLFDTPTEHYGGSGKPFNRELLKKYHYPTPYFLSGGIDETTLDQLATMEIQKPYALDINSKFETAPGLKQIKNITSFLLKTSSL